MSDVSRRLFLLGVGAVTLATAAGLAACASIAENGDTTVRKRHSSSPASL